MSDTVISGVLIIFCIFMFFQVAGDIDQVFKKRKFMAYIKEQFAKTLEEKAPEFVNHTPCFTSMPVCKFMEEEKKVQYAVVYNEPGTTYYTLFDFFYEEKEKVISERLEVTEFEEKDMYRILEPYKISTVKALKEGWRKMKWQIHKAEKKRKSKNR